MEKIIKTAGIASIALLLASCQNNENEATEQDMQPADENAQQEESSMDQPDTEDNSAENIEDENVDESESDPYEETEASPDYFIDTYIYNGETEFFTAFTINRDEGQSTSPEERLKSSLLENDPSEQEILRPFTEMTVEWPRLQVHFTEEGNQLSTTSAQTSLFYDSLFGMSDLYGIEEVAFLNPDGEENIIVAQRNVDEPILIEEERGLTRGYYTIYDKDSEQTFFLPGGVLEEPVENEDGEPLTFPETLEAMESVKSEDVFYDSAIIEGFEIVEASMEDDVATVQYTMDEEMVTEFDQIVFENAIQLAALDFHATEVHMLNDTLQVSTIYPLVRY
ncbi:hypothetical protein [Jeotgalibacillus malaysiensis]|uniref:hypothetical protein n=1 Tax=Jeotgalibacillus malaysiensis TaxID=1508404 RepID=UPI00384E6CC6